MRLLTQQTHRSTEQENAIKYSCFLVKVCLWSLQVKETILRVKEEVYSGAEATVTLPKYLKLLLKEVEVTEMFITTAQTNNILMVSLLPEENSRAKRCRVRPEGGTTGNHIWTCGHIV